MLYPYLGRKYLDGKPFVVMFFEEERGIVVMNKTGRDELNIGQVKDFDEDSFEYLPNDVDVILNND